MERKSMSILHIEMIMGIPNCQKNSNKFIQARNLLRYQSWKKLSIASCIKDFFKLSLKVLMNKSSVSGG
jgi:hypothetical protein